MTDKSESAKKAGAGKKTPQAKAQKSARGRTIELTAEDVTPSDKTEAGKAEAPEPAAEKPAGAKPAGSSPKGQSPDNNEKTAAPAAAQKRGGFGLFLIAAITGAALALGAAYGLLYFKLIGLRDDDKAQILEAVAGLEKRINQAAKQNEASLGALADKTRNQMQLYSDMAAKANASVAALKDEMGRVSSNVSGLESAVKTNAKSLAAINTAAQSALKAADDLARKLEAESKARAQLGPSIAANTAQVQKRAAEIARLGKELAAVKSTSGRLAGQVEDVFRGLKDIEKAVVEAGTKGGGAPSSAGVRISLLGNKFKRLEQDMAGLRNTLQSMPAVPPDVTPQISLLEKSLTRISKSISDLGGRDAARADELRRLRDKLAAFGHDIGKIAALDERLKGLSEKLAGLQNALGVVGKAADTLKIGDGGRSGALNALADRIKAVRAELNGKIEKLETLTAGISDAEAKLNAIDARLQDVKSVQAALAQQQKLAAKVQNANRLQRDLLSGGAFKDALFAFIEVAPEVKIPANVGALAGEGILTVDELRARFSALRQTLEAQNILDGGSGLMGKIMKSAGSVVSVRRTGPAAGTSSGAVASRVAAYLEQGKLALALKEAEGFSGDARQKTAPWIKAAQARLAAEKFAADLGALVYSGGKGE